MIQVDVDLIVLGHRISHMQDAVKSLSIVLDQWLQSDTIPEIDWSRVRSLDFQETLGARNELVVKSAECQSVNCEDFEDHVSVRRNSHMWKLTSHAQYAIIHGEKILKANIAELKRTISDQNLELIPDYEQRIAVLQDLKFIDDNSTVLLKGRVACEVNGNDRGNESGSLSFR